MEMRVTQLIQDSWLCKSFFPKALKEIKLSDNLVKVISLPFPSPPPPRLYKNMKEKKSRRNQGALCNISKFQESVFTSVLFRAL